MIFKHCAASIIMAYISYSQWYILIHIDVVGWKPTKNMQVWKFCYDILLSSKKTSSSIGILGQDYFSLCPNTFIMHTMHWWSADSLPSLTLETSWATSSKARQMSSSPYSHLKEKDTSLHYFVLLFNIFVILPFTSASPIINKLPRPKFINVSKKVIGTDLAALLNRMYSLIKHYKFKINLWMGRTNIMNTECFWIRSTEPDLYTQKNLWMGRTNIINTECFWIPSTEPKSFSHNRL